LGAGGRSRVEPRAQGPTSRTDVGPFGVPRSTRPAGARRATPTARQPASSVAAASPSFPSSFWGRGQRRGSMSAEGAIKGMDERLYRQRHSAAHMMAKAVVDMFPDAKVAIGPPVENGFYYEFDLPRSLTPDDLGVLEENMRAQMQEDLPFVQSDISKE